MTADSTTQFYAPRARLVDVATNTVIGGTFIADAAHTDASQNQTLDIVSAQVTLVNTGVAQLKVALNNQIFDGDGLPLTPPWLYNAFDRLRFGQWVRLDMSYGDAPWTKMIVAQINNMQFQFASTGPAEVTIIGEDLLSLFKRKPTEDKRYSQGRTEEQIVRDVVTRAGGVPRFAGSTPGQVRRGSDGWVENRGSLLAWPTISEDLPAITHQKAQTFLQFLQPIADRMDFEIFVDFTRNYIPLDEPGDPVPSSASESAADASAVMLHFEPARSLLSGGTPEVFVPLTWGRDLVDFTPTLKVWDLATGVTVKGRNPTSVERINHDIQGPDADGYVAMDLGKASSSEPDLVPATTLRRQLLQGVTVPTDAPIEVDVTNLGNERARLMAIATLRAKARELISVEATTIGFPSLRAGSHVDIAGLYAPFDGLYYIVKAVHVLDEHGYHTTLTLRRSGMQAPNSYVWSLDSIQRRAS